MASIIKGLIDYSSVSNPQDFPPNPTSFKQITVQEELTLPAAKPDIEEIVRVSAEVTIMHTRVIETPTSVSYEGQILTGRKLLVEGEIIEKIEYIADEPTHAVHAAHFRVPFSSYIVLDITYTDDDIVTVVPYIEDIYVQQIEKRKIFKNVVLFLNAAIN